MHNLIPRRIKMKKSSGNFYNSMLLYIHNLKKRDRYMIIVNSEKLFQKLMKYGVIDLVLCAGTINGRFRKIYILQHC